MTNDLFYKKSWYFRNALVRANYENSRRNIEKTLLPLEEFFKVLLFGEEIELKNRFLRIGSEHGSSVATAEAGLHRHDKNSDVGINVGINVGIKMGPSVEKVAAAIRSDSRVTIPELAKMIKVTERQAQRIIASLKKEAGLKRRGARKNGEWYFDAPATSAPKEA